MYTLSSSLEVLPGIGSVRLEQLQFLGLHTIKDLLFNPPFRYETIDQASKISDLKADTTACFHAKVLSKIPIKTQRFRSMVKVSVADETGKIDLTWFNTPFMLSALKVNESYYFTGKVALFKNKLAITNPTIEQETPLFGSLIPVYHESDTIHSRLLRKLIAQALELTDISDDPHLTHVYEDLKLLNLRTALTYLHNPSLIKPPELMQEQLKAAKYRLSFDELFILIKDVLERKQQHQRFVPYAKLTATNDDIKQFLTLLPYQPTASQLDAIRSISLDLVQPHPMQRLLQGEVGSGKTTVAAFALWIGSRSAPAVIVCPTKILASQHFQTLTAIFSKPTPSMKMPTIGLYTGKEKSIDADILIGTHALFHIPKLRPSLVIIDEEHRFGVTQRESFFQYAKKPHYISMTATPIPRTVALTALADYDVSYISPHKSSTNIKTWVVPPAKRASAYEWISTYLMTKKEQALIVCPFIEQSQIDTLSSVKSAKTEFMALKKIFVNKKLALLHGQMKDEEKQDVFDTMMEGKIDILVTTPVVEVGVDIPKASIIIIEGAERFGLAQLHQLRGRVGRRGQDAFCLLFTSQSTSTIDESSMFYLDQHEKKERTSSSRLEYFANTYNGNALAEYDFHHRGSGQILGTQQHGFGDLKFASWSDESLITLCKEQATIYLREQAQ